MKKYHFCVVLLLLVSALRAENVAEDGIVFQSVEAALAALSSNPAATLTEYQGWKIFKYKQDRRYILWSFTPPEHPAHPTAVRRSIARKGRQLVIDMDALCQSTEIFCASLMEEFKQINAEIIARESSSP